jgi:hypothetical protein
MKKFIACLFLSSSFIALSAKEFDAQAYIDSLKDAQSPGKPTVIPQKSWLSRLLSGSGEPTVTAASITPSDTQKKSWLRGWFSRQSSTAPPEKIFKGSDYLEELKKLTPEPPPPATPKRSWLKPVKLGGRLAAPAAAGYVAFGSPTEWQWPQTTGQSGLTQTITDWWSKAPAQPAPIEIPQSEVNPLAQKDLEQLYKVQQKPTKSPFFSSATVRNLVNKYRESRRPKGWIEWGGQKIYDTAEGVGQYFASLPARGYQKLPSAKAMAGYGLAAGLAGGAYALYDRHRLYKELLGDSNFFKIIESANDAKWKADTLFYETNILHLNEIPYEDCFNLRFALKEGGYTLKKLVKSNHKNNQVEKFRNIIQIQTPPNLTAEKSTLYQNTYNDDTLLLRGSKNVSDMLRTILSLNQQNLAFGALQYVYAKLLLYVIYEALGYKNIVIDDYSTIAKEIQYNNTSQQLDNTFVRIAMAIRLCMIGLYFENMAKPESQLDIGTSIINAIESLQNTQNIPNKVENINEILKKFYADFGLAWRAYGRYIAPYKSSLEQRFRWRGRIQ